MSGETLTWPRRSRFVDRSRTDDRGQPFEAVSKPKADDYATVEVTDPERKERYLERGWVAGTPAEAGLVEAADATEASTGASDAVDEVVDEDDEFDVEAFVDQTAQEQVDAIEAGDVDEQLDAVEDANAETNEYATVQEAIDNRRAELGG